MARTPTSATKATAIRRGSRARETGFTLLELLLVLTILGLAAIVAGPKIGAGGATVSLKRAGLELASGLRDARRAAVASAGESVLLLDLEQKSYRLERETREGEPSEPAAAGLQRSFPADSDITLETAESERREDGLYGIRFFPSGASTGGSIRIDHAGQSLSVTVDWLSGRVDIHGPE